MNSGNSIKKLTVSTALAGLALVLAPAAFAQSNYYIGIANMRDPVVVDLSVLDELGQESNLADLLRTGPVVISSGSPATQRLVPEPPLPNPAPSALVATVTAPAAVTVEPAGILQSGLEPAGVARQSEREADKLSGKAAASPVAEPVQTGAARVPDAASVAAVDPVDHTPEPVAVTVAAPEPVAVEPEPVAVAEPPEPEPVAIPEPEPAMAETAAVEIPVIEAPEVAPEVAEIIPETETDLTSSIVPPPEPVAEAEPEPVVEPAVPEASVTLDLPEPLRERNHPTPRGHTRESSAVQRKSRRYPLSRYPDRWEPPRSRELP